MTDEASGMLTKVSSTAVSTCTAMNATASSEMFRCRLVTAKRGRPGRRPCRLTRMPSTRTAVSSSRATIPVARLAYQNAVVPLICTPSRPVGAFFLFTSSILAERGG